MTKRILTKSELLRQKMQEAPHNYSCCIKEDCQSKHECLRYQQYLQREDEALRVINPKLIDGHTAATCSYYADALHPAVYAVGFTGMVNRLNKDEKERFQRGCMRSFCKSVYYDMRAGNRAILPYEQDMLREVAKQEGIEVESCFFDDAFEAPAWQ